MKDMLKELRGKAVKGEEPLETYLRAPRKKHFGAVEVI